MPEWLVLNYSVPTEPSARRVYVWRKLRRMGALLLNGSVWVLPSNDRTREHYRWLAAEIVELEGEAFVWETKSTLAGQEEKLIQRFLDQVNVSYREILVNLQDEDPDLVALSRQYQQVQTQDYFQSPLGRQVRRGLLDARGELD